VLPKVSSALPDDDNSQPWVLYRSASTFHSVRYSAGVSTRGEWRTKREGGHRGEKANTFIDGFESRIEKQRLYQQRQELCLYILEVLVRTMTGRSIAQGCVCLSSSTLHIADPKS